MNLHFLTRIWHRLTDFDGETFRERLRRTWRYLTTDPQDGTLAPGFFWVLNLISFGMLFTDMAAKHLKNLK